MTRTEFDEISTFWELRDFCAENDLYEITDEYIDGDDLDDCVWDDIRDWDGSWEDLGHVYTVLTVDMISTTERVRCTILVAVMIVKPSTT